MSNVTINNISSTQTTVATDDNMVLQTTGNVTKKVAVGTALRNAMVKSGYFDILPLWTYFQGSSAPTMTTVTAGRKELAFAGTGGTTNELWNKYHIPHDILLTMTNYEIHLHLEHNNAAPSGNAKFYIDYYIALPDGTFSGIVTKSVVFTPHATNNYLKNNIVKIESLTDNISSFIPDAVVSLRVYRDPGDVADTFADNIFYHTVDFHVQGDQKLTTSKDFGAGWVKS